MPIPLLEPRSLESRESTALVVVPRAVPVPRLYGPRFLAHVVDFCVVQGFSAYFAKMLALCLVAFYSPRIQAAGRGARPLFRAAWEYSTGELLAATCALGWVLYFVALPRVTGRTVGQGLFGLRITGSRGEAPSVRQLAYRLLGTLIAYATFGAYALTQRFDAFSDSRVTRD